MSKTEAKSFLSVVVDSVQYTGQCFGASYFNKSYRVLLYVVQVTLEELQAHAKQKLAAYQLPRQLQVLDEIPRNAMGKINKKMLRKELFPDKF